MRATAVIIIARLTHVCLSNGCLNKMYAAIAVQIGIQPFKKLQHVQREHREMRCRP